MLAIDADLHQVGSALGEIPKGWPIRPLKEVLNEVTERVGEASIPEYSSTNYGLQRRSERFTKKLSGSSANNKVVREGCLVFGLSRRVLNFGLMRDDIGSVSSAYRVLSVDSESIAPDLLEQMMRVSPAYYYGAVSASSREGQSVSLDALGMLNFVQPSRVAQEAYHKLTSPFLCRAHSVEKESLILAALREALLPKLISGELRIADAAPFIGGPT
jgi:type I restriction enzyme S subunit